MATLVLTVVGGAIGGPIGAALGGLVGRSIDGGLLRPKPREGPRLTELAIQTSSYGTPIPKIFGTMRIAGCVIWATDLIEQRASGRGGKGQPTTTSYSYAASFAVALSGRPIAGVGRIWAEGKLLRGAAGDWKSACGFRLHTGSEDQAPDPLIAAAEGAGLAPAHRGVAYAVFETMQLADYGNRIPSLTFEVFGDLGAVAIGAIAGEIGGDAMVGAGPTATLVGFSGHGDSARGVIALLASAAGAWVVPVAGGLEMRAEPGIAIDIADDGVGRDGARGVRTVRPIESVPRTLSVGHYDPARDYQTGTQTARRPGAGYRTEMVEMPGAIGASAARTMAEAMLARAEAARVRRRVTLDVSAIGVAPGESVAIVGEAGIWRVASASIEAMVVALDLAPLVAAPVVGAASSGRVSGAPDVAAGRTIVAAFEMPVLDDMLLTRPQLTIVAAGTEPGWRRAALLYSLDEGTSWIAGGATAMPGVIGETCAEVAAGSATLVDEDGVILVDLAHTAMTLEGADATMLDRGANLAMIGDELIQFGDATQVSARRWRLARLWRARRGTAAVPHSSGARFVLIEPATVATIALPAATIGQRVRVLASGVGDVGGLVESIAIVGGASIVPPAPVHLDWSGMPDGGAIVRWVRRSRIGWRWIDGVDAPLGEEREAYRATVTLSDTERTLVVAAPEAAITAAEREGGASVTVRQLGTAGESQPATINLREGLYDE